MTHADRKTPRAGGAPLKPGDRVHVSSGEVLREWRGRFGTVVAVSGHETRVLLDETPTRDEALVWMRHHHLMRHAPPAEPQETVVPWTSEELTASARASAAGDELPSADVPSPNAERARAFCIEHTDIGATTEDVADLVRLLDAVVAEAEARGRAEEREACARECEAWAHENYDIWQEQHLAAVSCAVRIRRRGEAETAALAALDVLSPRRLR